MYYYPKVRKFSDVVGLGLGLGLGFVLGLGLELNPDPYVGKIPTSEDFRTFG